MEATTVDRSNIVYLINRTDQDHVIQDVGLVFAAHGKTYDQYIRSVPRVTYEASLGLQSQIANGNLEELSFEDAQKELRKRSDNQVIARQDTAIEFEGDQMTELTNAAGNSASESEVNSSQTVLDIEE